MHRWNLQDPQNWVDRSGCSFHCQEHMDLFLWDVSTCRPIIWYQTDVVASLTFHLSPLWNDFNSRRVELARNTWHNNAEIARTFQRTWINHIQSPVSPVQCAFKECHIPRKWRGRQFSQQYTVWSIYTWTLQCPKSRVNPVEGLRVIIQCHSNCTDVGVKHHSRSTIHRCPFNSPLKVIGPKHSPELEKIHTAVCMSCKYLVHQNQSRNT